MRGPKPAPMELNEREQRGLRELVRRHSTPQQIALRGRMILAAAQGKNNAQVSRELRVKADTVRCWRMRWIGLQAVSLDDCDVHECLSDVPRPGGPAQITVAQTCQMIALACEAPSKSPISHWTGREMADEVMARGIVAHYSSSLAHVAVSISRYAGAW